mgnify:CR=1 FL=1
MSAIVSPAHLAAAREFRSLSATYEANRDLVLMGAYREGTDPLLDRANALHGAMTIPSVRKEPLEIAAPMSLGAYDAVASDSTCSRV